MWRAFFLNVFILNYLVLFGLSTDSSRVNATRTFSLTSGLTYSDCKWGFPNGELFDALNNAYLLSVSQEQASSKLGLSVGIEILFRKSKPFGYTISASLDKYLVQPRYRKLVPTADYGVYPIDHPGFLISAWDTFNVVERLEFKTLSMGVGIWLTLGKRKTFRIGSLLSRHHLTRISSSRYYENNYKDVGVDIGIGSRRSKYFANLACKFNLPLLYKFNCFLQFDLGMVLPFGGEQSILVNFERTYPTSNLSKFYCVGLRLGIGRSF